MTQLAHAAPDALSDFLTQLDTVPDFQFLKPPETGLAMVRGRTGGSGAPFNLGEVSMTRCVVSMPDSLTGEQIDGVAYIAGRDRIRTENAAKLDALFQDRGFGVELRAKILPRLSAANDDRKRETAAKTAATKVEFFTMERGS